MKGHEISIIGAGASGVLLAAELCRRRPGRKIALIGAGARAATGLAYGTPYGAHLLNVPAARMSAFHDSPDHFLEWLRAQEPAADAGTFAPRLVYGRYLSDVLDESARSSADLHRIAGTATGLGRTSDGRWSVRLSDGRTIESTVVVLALGNLAPAPLQIRSKNYLADPWAPGVALGLSFDAPVLLIGTGLTMIDLVLTLRTVGHRGAIHALSRRGLLPRTHASTRGVAPELPALPASPRDLLRWIRDNAESTGEWRPVVDALRPVTNSIWRSWTERERRAFLRHLRPWWDVHRHRAAPQVGAEIDSLMEAGNLIVHRGRIRSVEDEDEVTRVIFGTPGSGDHSLIVSRIVNCTGPATDYSKVDLSLVAQLRVAGLLTPDPLGLGIETADDGKLLGRDGVPVGGLYTIGSPRRGSLWESTAIPEIRAQAHELAALLSR